ncbi:MAG: DEAD/DEAH box helicase [Methanomethylophilus sp.]|jgi:helicase
MKFAELDIPQAVKDLLREQGFDEMYPPQAEAIPKALTGRNLVAAVPTASGKSLIGFIPALKMIMTRYTRVLYVVPLKALASEKRDDLAKFSSLGIRVVAATGDPERDDDVTGADIVIATSEKADSMIRHGNRWLDGLGLLIADEVHMIHDPGRGPTLEVAMTKLMMRNPSLQVIALSATVSNAEDLARWLDADLVKSDWRPTKLKEGVYFNGEIVFEDASSLPVPPEKDEMWGLIKQTVEDGGQVMVFVNSRRSTESVASKYAKRMLALTNSNITEAERRVLEGGAETTAVGTKLADCVACGIAFHHAGLSYAQRRSVEEGFRGRRIKCIVATPTLAAGINLPARRVIVRDTTRFESNAGNVPIPVMEIKQMCGRAGRPGYDPWGEAVLIAKSYDDYEHLMDDYVNHDTERITSKLGNESALRSHILGLIATGDADSEESIKRFLEMTFYGSTNQMYGIEELISNVVDFLEEQDMVEVTGDNIRILPFGKRASDLYIDPWTAVILKKAVLKMDNKTDELQIMQAVACTPDVMGMYPKKGDQALLEATDAEYDGDWLCSIEDECGTDDDAIAWDNHMSDLKTALLLRFWIDEKTEEYITDTMKIGPGDIRARVDSADWILYAMNEVAMIFNPDASKTIRPLLTRMRYGVKEELIPLVTLKGVGRARARTLFNAGMRTRADIARADEKELAALPKIGSFLARSLKEQSGYTEPLPQDEPPPEDDEETAYMLEKMAAEEDEKAAGEQKKIDMY